MDLYHVCLELLPEQKPIRLHPHQQVSRSGSLFLHTVQPKSTCNSRETLKIAQVSALRGLKSDEIESSIPRAA